MAQRVRRPNGVSHHPTRSIRVDDRTWKHAKRRAEREGMTMSRLVNLLLEGYGEKIVSAPTQTLVVKD